MNYKQKNNHQAICGFLAGRHLQFNEYYLMYIQNQRLSLFYSMSCKKQQQQQKTTKHPNFRKLYYSHVIIKRKEDWDNSGDEYCHTRWHTLSSVINTIEWQLTVAMFELHLNQMAKRTKSEIKETPCLLCLSVKVCSLHCSVLCQAVKTCNCQCSSAFNHSTYSLFWQGCGCVLM